MKTFSIKKSEISRKWYVLDATQVPLGRLSTVAARLLIGKDKPSFTPHMDGGDYVIVINASQVGITGNKLENKAYYRHSGYPGGIRKTIMSKAMENNPKDVIFHSVRGMLPVNKLRDGRLERLKIYTDDQHNHAAQKPENYELKRGNK